MEKNPYICNLIIATNATAKIVRNNKTTKRFDRKRYYIASNYTYIGRFGP